MPDEKNAGALRPFINVLKCGDPISHLNLTIVPITSQSSGSVEYMLAEEAIAAGLLMITEVDDSGSVPELLVMNTAETMILLVDGEELVGAKQNRILNTTVLVRPNAKTRIPVSCVEQGRWRHNSRVFSSGNFSPAKLRARKSRSVGRNLRATGEAASDQGEVWDEVAAVMQGAGAASPTMAMHDVVDKRRDSLDEYINAIPYPTGSRGVITAIGGKFTAMDVFDKPETLEQLWLRLLTGYALDAVSRHAQQDKKFTAKGARELVEHLGELECQPCPSVGAGDDWRFESGGVVGQALVLDDACVHLSVFPNEHDGPGRIYSAPRIARPSRRRRNRRKNTEQE